MSQAERNIYTGEEAQDKKPRHTIEILWGRMRKTERYTLSESDRVKNIEQQPKLNIGKEVVEACERAIQNGRNEIVVADIGSGRRATLLKSFEDESTFLEVHEFLRTHDGFTVNIVGVTAHHKDEDRWSILYQNSRDIGNSTIVVTNYAYLITRKNSLKQFFSRIFEGNGFPQPHIDFAISSWGIGYFSPQNFRTNLTHIVELLAPGSRFFILDYDFIPPGFNLTFNFNRQLRASQSSWYGQLEHLIYISPIDLEEIETSEIVETYERARQICLDRGIVSESDIEEFITVGDDERDLILQRGDQLLSLVYKRLRSKSAARATLSKRETLANLDERDDVSVSYGNRTAVITKA